MPPVSGRAGEGIEGAKLSPAMARRPTDTDPPPRRRARPSALAFATAAVTLIFGLGVLYLALSYRAEPALTTPVVAALPPAATVGPTPPTEPPLTEPRLATVPSPPPAEPPRPLNPAPDPALIAASAFGPLPVIGPDGRQAWRVYARPPAEGPQRPRVAILLAGLGLSAPQTQAAIQLPGEITLGFLPHAQGLAGKIADARAAGHEVLLHIPMEPRNYPSDDPGPHALLTSLTPVANLERLDWSLARAVGYVGIINRLGARLAESEADFKPILTALRDRGLMYLDASESTEAAALRLPERLAMAHTGIDRRIDREAARGAIDAQLADLEEIARRTGQAVGLGEPFPVTIERLAHWVATLQSRGIELAPISAMPAKR
jgi:polysaccharide deacetylase 2 family uncharacterized protein YibQ